MKTRDEIQRAHDILHPVAEGIAFGEPIIPLSKQNAAALHSAHDVLAWILDFPCGEIFDDNLAAVLSALREAGYQEVPA